MCRHPLTIVNPSKYIDVESSQQLYITVPCGHCSECYQSQKNEWLLRLYFEQLGAYSSDQYVIFDTLTYRPDSLPYLSHFLDVPSYCDFPCFSRRDVQLFLKRLRDKFDRPIRYFIVCEYGHDYGQKVPYRPHYHCLFFVPKSIPPLLFSKAVSDSWQLGRTDGLPFRPANYVIGNVFDKVSSKVSDYVLKYVTKSSVYSDLVEKRLDRLFHYDSLLVDSARKFVRQFHCQSLNFGYGFLKQVYTPDILSKMSHLRVLDSHGFKYVPIPLSLKRYMFYRYERVDGRVHWIPLPLLVSYNLASFKSRLTDLAHKFTNHVSWRLALDIASYVLLKRYRFSLSDSPLAVFSNQYNTDNSGFRNYASRDRLIYKTKSFHNDDFGSEADGYKTGYTFRYVPLGDGRFEFSRLSDLDSLISVNDFYESVIAKSSLDTVGDPQSDVAKVKDRILNTFKMFKLC